MNKFFTALFLLLSILGYSQKRFSEIDFTRISQQTILSFISAQEKMGFTQFDQLLPSVSDTTNICTYDSNCHHFKLKALPEEAWRYYLASHPSRVWNGKVVSCGLIYSPDSDAIIYANDPYDSLCVGQLFFIEMRVFGGLAKFPVCMMVTKIDNLNRTITFSYINSGESKGSQTIQLTENGRGGTKIIHSSYHLTSNPLRDKTLYPIYHKKAISEVHRNVKRILLSE